MSIEIAEEKVPVRGFIRMQLVDAKNGKPTSKVGPWFENTVVNLGFQDYIVGSIGGVAGSKQVTHMAIGTGTAPATDATSLDGETGVRVTTSNSAVSSKTLQCTCQFAGSDMGSTVTIQNVGLANISSGGTVLCGTTFATSQWAWTLKNQNAVWRRTMVTLFKVSVKFGEHPVWTIPSQAISNIMEGVETIRQTLCNGVEEIVRTVRQLTEASGTRNDLPLSFG